MNTQLDQSPLGDSFVTPDNQPRVKLDEQNRRIYTPIPRATLSWRRNYNLHSAIERIFSRFAQGYQFVRHYILGHAKMKVRATPATTVMMAMAHGQARIDGNSSCVLWSQVDCSA